MLADYPKNVRGKVLQALTQYGIKLHDNFAVAEVKENGVVSKSGETINLTQSIWCTGAIGSEWLTQTALATNDKHFIKVNQSLQSISHPNVFAAGDIAEMIDDPRPKAGVYAVREAPWLERNLRLAFASQPLTEMQLQTQFLSLLSLGDRVAVASRNGLAVKGRWVWRWKDIIDRKFMKLFPQ